MRYSAEHIRIGGTSDLAVAYALFKLANFSDESSRIYIAGCNYRHRKLGSRIVSCEFQAEPPQKGIFGYYYKKKPELDFTVVRIRDGKTWELTDEYLIEYSERISPSLIQQIEGETKAHTNKIVEDRAHNPFIRESLFV